MNKKIIAIDLDGTLLNTQSRLSDYTKKTIQAVHNLGHKIIITTGRPYRMAIPFYEELELDTPMINFNGSLTLIPHKKWDYEQSVTIDKSFLLDMVRREDEIQADFIAGEYRKRFYITHTYHHSINPELFGVKEISEFTKLIPEKVTSNPNAILLQTRAEDKYSLAEEMSAYYKHDIEINTWGGPLNILECSSKGVNKAFALKHLLKAYNQDASNLYAFGDEQNDKQMLALAGKSFAMKNANPELLPFAKEQLSWTNEEDGVAKQLETLFL